MNKTPGLLTSLISSIAPKLIRYASTPSSSNYAVILSNSFNFSFKIFL